MSSPDDTTQWDWRTRALGAEAELRNAEAERNRLRAVVDALRRHRDADARWTALSEDGDEDDVRIADNHAVKAWDEVVEALAQLDIGDVMGGSEDGT